MMARVEADYYFLQKEYNFCSNCFMHSWKQPEDKSILTECPGCQLIEYCGEACRKEHWSKVHKNHCEFLADPTKCPQSQHDAETCAICRPFAGTGKGKPRLAGRDKRDQVNSSYDCFIKSLRFTPGLDSPHPFPMAGAGNDLMEKSFIVMQKLVHMFKRNPRVAMVCSAEMDQMEEYLWDRRREIWLNRKVFPHPQIVYTNVAGEIMYMSGTLAKRVTAKVVQGKAGKDASELWKIIQVILVLIRDLANYRQQDALKDPVETMPEQFRDLVRISLENKCEFLDAAEDIIDSLSTQVIPYEDIIKKLCGGKKRQNCSFCGIKMEVTELYEIKTSPERPSYNPFGVSEEIMTKFHRKRPSVLFDVLSVRKYSCGSQECSTRANREKDKYKLTMAVVTEINVRDGLRCDFCLKLIPIDKAHRCCNCLTVWYCSKSCHKEDKEEHKEKYCIKDKRKTKEDRSMRRQKGETVLGNMAAVSEIFSSGTRATVNEILEPFQFV